MLLSECSIAVFYAIVEKLFNLCRSQFFHVMYVVFHKSYTSRLLFFVSRDLEKEKHHLNLLLDFSVVAFYLLKHRKKKALGQLLVVELLSRLKVHCVCYSDAYHQKKSLLIFLFVFFLLVRCLGSSQGMDLWTLLSCQHMIACNYMSLVLDDPQVLQTFILLCNLVFISTRQREVEVKFLSQEVFYSFPSQKEVCIG